jgi:hypothetical protein
MKLTKTFQRIVWVAFAAAALICSLRGRPPANAQDSIVRPPVQMTLGEYNQERLSSQEENLRELNDFKRNQENFNKELGTRLMDLEASQASEQGWLKGGFGVLSALGALGVGLQFKRKVTE